MTFSLIITFYNQRDFIQPALESALGQNPRISKEIIAVDDGSTDGSRQLLETYRDLVQLRPLPSNQGPLAARNHGAAAAKGQYLVFLDGDDVYMPWALDAYERIILERKPAVILGRLRWFEGSVPVLRTQDIPHEIEFVEYAELFRKDHGVGLSASTFVVERQAFWRVGGWSPDIFQLDCPDLCAKLGLLSTVIILAPRTTFYRIHKGNSIHSVPPFIKNLYRLMAKERAGEYPGGTGLKWRRRAWLGGLFQFWIIRSVRAGLYKEAAKLILTGWPTILAAVIYRGMALLRGRQPAQKLPLQFSLESFEIKLANRS